MTYGSRAVLALLVVSLAVASWPATTEASWHARIGGTKFHGLQRRWAAEPGGVRGRSPRTGHPGMEHLPVRRILRLAG